MYVATPLARFYISVLITNNLPAAKPSLVGLTQHTQPGHIARATLEATCFQTHAILSAMEKDSGQPLHELAVDGGMSNSDFFIQVRTPPLKR
jgi:glycerol kinase